MKKLVRKLSFCLAATLAFSVNVNADSVKITEWTSYNGNEFKDYSGFTQIEYNIGDKKIALNTSNQKFFYDGNEVAGKYDYSINDNVAGKYGKLYCGYNELTIFFDSDDGNVSTKSVISLNINKESQKKPSLKILKRTKNSITVKKVAGCEYKITGRTWQVSNKFKNLKSNKTYKVYIRKKETETKAASKPVSIKVKTK